MSSIGRIPGEGGKKRSETVSETHLLLAGQQACENQAAFHGPCWGNHTVPGENHTIIALRTEGWICSFDLFFFVLLAKSLNLKR